MADGIVTVENSMYYLLIFSIPWPMTWQRIQKKFVEEKKNCNQKKIERAKHRRQTKFNICEKHG